VFSGKSSNICFDQLLEVLYSKSATTLKMGMTETLVAFLAEITVVVVVMCIFATSGQLW